MAKNTLPLHPTKRHPLTGEPLRALAVRPASRRRSCAKAEQSSSFVGNYLWPMMGGDETAEAAAAAAAAAATKAAADKAAADKAAEEAAKTDTGFPANTPVEQMTAPQREAYYKNQAQKWQGRAENSYGLLNDLGAKTPEEIAAVKEKVTKHDELERELMSDKDKAVAEAKDEAKGEVRGELLPELVRAKFEAAAAGRIVKADGELDEERLTALLEPLDLTKFVTSDSKVDTAKVKTYIDGVAPAKGNSQRNGPRIPGVSTGGSTAGSGRTSAGSVAEVMEQRRAARAEKH